MTAPTSPAQPCAAPESMSNGALRTEVRVIDTVYEETGKMDRARFDALLEELDRRGAAYPDEIGGRR